ncbi:MAG: OPT/YSL family transporter, partial [Candidatus Omnitrophica bacterium]|nr:OPT/YSL family transporter [Candidatus Omnitrophota bacterium]
LPAPQAVLFSSLVNGFFGDVSLPWNMVVWGVIIGFIILIIDTLLEQNESKFRLHIMPVAVGIYLPFGLSVPIFLGGLVHHFLKGRSAQESEDNRGRGVLAASGLIAGESIMGVLLGVLAYLEIKSWHLGDWFGDVGMDALSVLVLLLVVLWMFFLSKRASRA